MPYVGDQAWAISPPLAKRAARAQPMTTLSRTAAAISSLRTEGRRMLVMAGKGSTSRAVPAKTTSIEKDQAIE